jgi:hypothetical protein
MVGLGIRAIELWLTRRIFRAQAPEGIDAPMQYSPRIAAIERLAVRTSVVGIGRLSGSLFLWLGRSPLLTSDDAAHGVSQHYRYHRSQRGDRDNVLGGLGK